MIYITATRTSGPLRTPVLFPEDRVISKRTRTISVALLALYAGFFLWYTPWGGPLSEEEIEQYVEAYASGGETDADELLRLRRFLEEDTGGDFVMVNVIELQEPPLPVAGVEPGDSASDVLAKYMEYMWPALLRRACHPVLAGSAAADALDLWGLDGARTWSQGAAMRYRSRRDMMEISTHPEFDGRHGFKIAAMKKTVAFPLDPWLHLGDPRLLLGALTLILVLLVQTVSLRRRLAAGGRAAGVGNAPETSPQGAGA